MARSSRSQLPLQRRVRRGRHGRGDAASREAMPRHGAALAFDAQLARAVGRHTDDRTIAIASNAA
eukprot:5953464-Pyramimonas_sp.AAC.1